MIQIAVVSARPRRDPAVQALLAVRRRGVELRALDPSHLGLRVPGGVTARRAPLRASVWLVRRLNHAGSVDVQFDLLELAEWQGFRLINPPRGLSISESKLQTTFLLARDGIRTPRTVTATTLAEARAALAEFGQAVLKPIYGSLGEGLLRLAAGADDGMLRRALRAGPVYLQEYLPSGARDLRILVLGGEVLGAIYREAPPGEWRANISQGGRCVACTPPAEAVDAAVRATRLLGLDYAGVDLIAGPGGWHVIEVNGSPGWQALAEATGRDVASALVDYAVRVARATG